MTEQTNPVAKAVETAVTRCDPPNLDGLARKLGVHPRTIDWWIARGSMRGARTELSIRMAELSGMSIKELANGNGSK